MSIELRLSIKFTKSAHVSFLRETFREKLLHPLKMLSKGYCSMEIENAKSARAIFYSIQINLNSMLFICEPLGGGVHDSYGLI